MSTYSLVGYGGVGSVTGANFLLQTPEGKILVDCGLIQGSWFSLEENHAQFSYNPKEISMLLVTHAHMDHIGRIPKLIHDGFSGTIYSTVETKELASLMLDDAFGLITKEAREAGKDPLYDKVDIEKALSLWKVIPYRENFDLTKNISVYLRDAGHVLGSSIIELTLKDIGKKIAFTGDLGNSPTPLLRDTEFVNDVDYMVMESVYGDRNHEPKQVRDERLREIIDETIKRNGTVVIPAFSLERTQVILYEINELIESKKIPSVPVFLDSPLAIRVTEVYRTHSDEFNKKITDQIRGGDDIFDFPGLRVVRSPDESNAIHSTQGAKIIIAGSGMSVGGRVLSHEAFYLADPNATILLVGYQVPGSLGRRIEEKESKVTVNGTPVVIKAKIEKISGYSSHKDSNNLVEFASHTAQKIKQIFVAMGENKSATYLTQRLRNELGINATVMEKEREYEIT